MYRHCPEKVTDSLHLVWFSTEVADILGGVFRLLLGSVCLAELWDKDMATLGTEATGPRRAESRPGPPERPVCLA